MAAAPFDPNARGWTPEIEIKVDGKEVAGIFYSRLISATIRDEAGQSSDMCTIVLDDARNELAVPREKARIEISLGFRETGLVDRGTYELQNVEFEGGDDGERLILQGKAADLRRKLKGSGRKAYENTTLGEVARDIARGQGMTALVDRDLDGIRIAFEPRIDQSDIDFLTRLGDEFGAVVKPAGDKLVVAKRGSRKTVSGLDLPLIVIRKDECISWQIAPDGRTAYGKVKAHWVDQKTGKRRFEAYETGLDGPDYILPEALPDQDRAMRAAEAEGMRLTSCTGNGSFRLYGRPDAQAEALVQAVGFRDGIAGLWRAEAVEDVFDEDGYTTTVQVTALEKGGGQAKE
jgi:phage protein D